MPGAHFLESTLPGVIFRLHFGRDGDSHSFRNNLILALDGSAPANAAYYQHDDQDEQRWQ